MSEPLPLQEFWPDVCPECKGNPHTYNGGLAGFCHGCKKFLCHACCEEGYDGGEDVWCDECFKRGYKGPEPTAQELESLGQLNLLNASQLGSRVK